MENIRDIHISFDLDGTLINSVPLMRKSWENVNSILGLGVSWSEYRAQIGLPFKEICKNLAIEGDYKRVFELYFGFNNENIASVHAMPGLQTLIDYLTKERISWSIVTSKPAVTARPILKRFNLEPDLLITEDEVSKGKPNTEAGLLLKSKINASKIFYVGDAVVDLLFSLNCNYEFLRFRTPDEEARLLFEDDCIFDNLSNKFPTVSHLDEIVFFVDGVTRGEQ